MGSKGTNNKETRGVTFILIRPASEILMQLRDNKSEYYPNRWCFPGGICNINEKPIDTVIREAYEEFGLHLDINDCQLLMMHKPQYDKTLVDYVFICLIDSVQQPVLNEGAAMKWMKINEIKKLKLGFEQETLIARLENFLHQNR